MGGPGRGLAPAHAGGGGHAEQVDGVRLEGLQEVLGAVLRQLHAAHRAVCGCAVRQAVGRHPAAAQLGGERLPAHLDVGRTVAGQTELWSTQGH